MGYKVDVVSFLTVSLGNFWSLGDQRLIIPAMGSEVGPLFFRGHGSVSGAGGYPSTALQTNESEGRLWSGPSGVSAKISLQTGSASLGHRGLIKGLAVNSFVRRKRSAQVLGACECWGVVGSKV